MKVFVVFRLMLWAIVLGVCVVVAGLYLTLSKTALRPAVVQSWAVQAHLGETVRDQVIAPQLITTASSSVPSGFALLPPEIIKKSLTEAIPTNVLDMRLEPATSALTSWLDSKSSDITYSIDATDFRTKFFDRLAANLTTEIATLPKCSSQNDFNDIQNGVCFYDEATSTRLVQETIQAVKDNSVETFGDTITDTSAPITPINTKGSNIPDLLNMLSAASLLASAIFILGALWLILRKRSAGVIALGAAGVLGGIGLFIVSEVLQRQLTKFDIGALYQPLLKLASGAIADKNRFYALLATALGVGLIIIGTALLLFFHRRHHHNSAMHFSHTR